jgi:hypothetical protein
MPISRAVSPSTCFARCQLSTEIHAGNSDASEMLPGS